MCQISMMLEVAIQFKNNTISTHYRHAIDAILNSKPNGDFFGMVIFNSGGDSRAVFG